MSDDLDSEKLARLSQDRREFLAMMSRLGISIPLSQVPVLLQAKPTYNIGFWKSPSLQISELYASQVFAQALVSSGGGQLHGSQVFAQALVSSGGGELHATQSFALALVSSSSGQLHGSQVFAQALVSSGGGELHATQSFALVLVSR